jgi:toxin ParE1/3/4
VKPIIFHPKAEEEYAAAIAWYEAQRPGLGLDFQDEVQILCSLIAQLPETFPEYEDLEVRKCNVNRFPYTLFYLDHEDQIWIVAVAHQKRKPGYWKERLSDI